MAGDIIIIGAPRSGTNMLRDVLTRVPGYGTWPCDELPLLWRHGNRAFPSDEFSAGMARPSVRDFLRGRFARLRRRRSIVAVVEKTCANSLRVEFVARCFPEARYVFITRDGIDASASALRRWHARRSFGYRARKARQVPLTDLPWYAARFSRAHLTGLRPATGTTRRTEPWWGPRLEGYQDLLHRLPLDEVCLLQWRRCVEASRRGLGSLPAEQVFRVSYERFVTSPHAELHALLAFLRKSGPVDASWTADVSAESVGRGRQELVADRLRRLEELGGDTLRGVRDGS